MVTVHSRLYFNQKRIYAPLWAVAAALAVEKPGSVFTLLLHYQQASMWLVSAFRRRRRRLRLHRARFRNCPWSRSPRPAELCMVRDWNHVFYFAFFLSCRSFGCSLHHLCWLRWFQWKESYSLKPIVLQIAASEWARVRVRHSLKFLVSLKRKLRVRWTRKKICVLPSRVKDYTSGQKCIFSLLNLSRHVLRTMTVQWFKKQTCLVCQNLEASDAGYRLLWRLAKFCSLGPKYVIYKTPH